MARISGVDLPREKRVVVALTYIYGVGRSRAEEVVETTGLDPDTRVRDLTDDEVQRIRVQLDNYRVEGDLRREVANNIKRKIEIGSYQGIRHRLGLPVRGQRTHTNARGRKGPRRAVGGIRKHQRKH
jgi:small subunit ribosomal protein S13